MSLRTYRAYSMAEALAAVKDDLGADASIVHTRSYKRGGLLGIGRKTVVEVTATSSADARANGGPVPANRAAKAGAAGGRAAGNGKVAGSRQQHHQNRASAAAQRAYAAVPEPVRGLTPGAAPPASPAAAGGASSVKLDSKKHDLLAAIEEHRRRTAAGLPLGEAGRTASPATRGAEIELKLDRFEIASQSAEPGMGPMTSATPTPAPNPNPERNAEGDDSPAQPVSAVAKRFILHDPEKKAALATTAPRGPGAAAPPSAAVPANRTGVLRHAPEATSTERNPSDSEARQAVAELESKLLSAVEKTNRESAAVHDEMHVIRDMVGQILARQRAAPPLSTSASSLSPTRGYDPGPLPALVYDVYDRLVEQDLCDGSIEEIINGIQRELSAEALHDAEEVRAAARSRIAELVQVAETPFILRGREDRPLTLALIGPTGVGKTTTLAKLAATFKIRHGRRVGLVTSDTYRIAAVEQLRTYADIIGLPLKVALTPAEMAEACRQLRDCDVIMIDTAGRSQNDHEKLEELNAFINAAEPDEVHLVLSATASEKVLDREIASFSRVRADRIILTKLDEAAGFGVIVNVTRRVEKPISFFTTGQEVPEHFEPATSDRIADLILGGDLRRGGGQIPFVAHTCADDDEDESLPTSAKPQARFAEADARGTGDASVMKKMNKEDAMKDTGETVALAEGAD